MPYVNFIVMERSFFTLKPSEKFVEQIEQNADVLKFRKNQVLYSEGSTPLGVFFLEEGEVVISKLASQGKEQVLTVVSEKEVLSCADLILNKKYNSSARATRDSTALFLPKSEFLKLIAEKQEVNYHILIQLAQEVNSLESKVISLAYKPLRGRLAETLLDLNKTGGETSDTAISLSRTDLAGLTGTVTGTLNRLLCEFQKEEMISISEKQIRILDKAGLDRLCEMYA